MIFSSGYWKKELSRQIAEFEKWAPRYAYCFKDISWERFTGTEWCAESGFRLERTLFYSAMTIRRLMDSNKVTDRLRQKPLTLETFRAKIQKPHSVFSRMGHVEVHQWFDMDNPETVSIVPYDLASEILHSYTLEFVIDGAQSDLDSILVASAKNQFERAISIPRATWLGLLRDVVADEVMQVSVTANRDGNPHIQIS